jgi:hypothetical protein
LTANRDGGYLAVNRARAGVRRAGRQKQALCSASLASACIGRTRRTACPSTQPRMIALRDEQSPPEASNRSSDLRGSVLNNGRSATDPHVVAINDQLSAPAELVTELGASRDHVPTLPVSRDEAGITKHRDVLRDRAGGDVEGTREVDTGVRCL